MVVPALSKVPAAAASLLYLGIAAIFLKIEVLDASTSPFAPVVGDLLAYYYPTLKYGFAQLRSGHLPLWNPYQSCGSPFIASLHEGFFYPFYAPFVVFDAATAINLHIILHLAIAALGTYLLCRHFDMRWESGVIAGLIYSYAGTMMIKIYFPDFLTSAAWIPWIFLFANTLLTRPSRRATGLLAAVLGMSLLGGHGVQFLYFTAWALLPLVLVRSSRMVSEGGLRSLRAPYAALLLSVVLGLVVGLVRLLPTAEFVAQSWRPPGGLGTLRGSMPVAPAAFREGLLTPEPSGITSAFHPHRADKVRAVYVGVISLALALLGLVLWRQRAVSLPIAAAGLAAVSYSFGARGALFPIMARLPAGDWFQGAERALTIFSFSVAILVGAGLDALLRSSDERASGAGRRRWLAALVLVSAAVVAVFVLGRAFGAPRGMARLTWYSGLGWLLLATLALGGHYRRVRVAILPAVAMLILIDLLHLQQHPGTLPSQLQAYFSRNDDLYAAIRARQGFDRTYIFSSFAVGHPLLFHTDTAKAGLNHGIWMPTDYEPLSNRRFSRYLSQLGPSFPFPIGYSTFVLHQNNLPLLGLMSVRFVVVDERTATKVLPGLDDARSAWKRVDRFGDIGLYEYANAVPRAFIAHRAEVVPDETELLNRLKEIDPRAVALVEEPIADAIDGGSDLRDESSRAEIVDYAPNRVVVDTHTERPGLLVLTDQYDRDWQVSIDGIAARAYRTNYLFRGVPIAAGTHRVEFVYRPTAMRIGALGTLLGLVGVFVLLRRSQ